MAYLISSANGILFFIQIIIIALPFPGYIHPDEYFQSAEIMARDTLQLKSRITWEWNTTEPARNIAFPFLSAGLPFNLLKMLQVEYSANILIILPRLAMLSMTYLIEIFLILIISNEKANKNNIELLVLFFRSSHVSLVFLTRTFSNTLETLFFAMIIFIVGRIKENEEKTSIFMFLIGCICSFGVFARPSFIAFMFGAIINYVIHLLFNNNVFSMIKKSFKFVFLASFGFILISVINICIDSYYFSRLEKWHITPVNLIRYNSDINNLRIHGIHFKGLHFVVNMFLLFGPIYVIFIYFVFKESLNALRLNLKQLKSLQVALKTSLLSLTHNSMIVATILPVIILSLIPHQEPRFLVAVIVPLLCEIVLHLRHQVKPLVIFLWILFNFLSVLWFGFLHQAGLVPVLAKLNEQIRKKPSTDTFHLVFWKTYMPPEHLLGVQENDTSVKIFDLGGTDTENLVKFIKSINVTSTMQEKVCLNCTFLDF